MSLNAGVLLVESYRTALESAQIIQELYAKHLAESESSRGPAWVTRLLVLQDSQTKADAIVSRLLAALKRHVVKQ